MLRKLCSCPPLNQPVRTDNFRLKYRRKVISYPDLSRFGNVHAWRRTENLVASKGDTPTKPVKGRKSQEENANDFCRLGGVNLEIKFGNFQKSTKYTSTDKFI